MSDYLITILLGVLIATIPLILAILFKLIIDSLNIKGKITDYLNTKHKTISLKFKQLAYDEEKSFLRLKYILFVVHWGKQKPKNNKDLLHMQILFKGGTTKTAKLPVHNSLGTTFKCFVDYKDRNKLNKLKDFLARNGFTPAYKDGDKSKKRLWFHHPGFAYNFTDYPNNYIHPRT